MSRSKDKGTRHETSIVNALRERGRPHVERRSLNGANDRGDIAGIVGVVIEAKAAARLAIPAWLRELDAEIANDNASTGALWCKQVGKADAIDGFIVMRPTTWLRLLAEAGY